SIEAMLAGRRQVFIGLGGNFIHAVPDTPRAYEVESIEAMLAGRRQVFIGLGGNFIHAVPDTPRAYE
ncbi:hypothetical protein C7E18_24585, partial [Stenotrophomonas maltophilia]